MNNIKPTSEQFGTLLWVVQHLRASGKPNAIPLYARYNIRLFRYGRAFLDNGRHHVWWRDLGRREWIKLDDCPPEFAKFATGQPFEATILVDPHSMRMMKMVEVEKRTDAQERGPSRSEREELWNRIAGSSSLPAASLE